MELDYFFPLIVVLFSLMWVYLSFRYYLYYLGKMDSGVTHQDRNGRLIKGAQISLLVSILAFTGASANLFNLSESAMPPTATATLAPGEGTLSMPGVDQPVPTPSLSPILLTPSPESSPTPEVVPGTGFALIGNTNGFGVFVRSEPGLQYEMLTQLPDGSRVEMTGEVQTADGFSWQRVRLEDGRLGWIADNFLIPEP